MTLGSASNSYEILAKLAEGGMAELFLARNLTGAGVERIVVLKRILPSCAHDERLVNMFVHEARLAAQLQHANIAHVFDVGRLGSSYFFTMEYVHGETLRELMLRARERRMAIPIATVLTILAGAAAGLHHAHDRRAIDGRQLSIVHSDVSPSNLIVGQDGVVKVVDFGIARAAGAAALGDGGLRGKIAYLSPEQCHSQQEIDRRSDLFSLGIVAWELLTLSGLFRRASDYETLMAIESEPTSPPSRFRPDIPLVVDNLVLKLLAKAPSNRFQTAGALVEAIEATAHRLGLMLSVSSIGRLLHDLFGDKPMPWLQGRSQQLIVTSDPIGGRGSPRVGPVDEQLRTLPPLTPPRTELPSDTIRDTPLTENIEEIRNRVFREAKARKTPVPSVVLEDEEELDTTFVRKPTAELIPDAPRAAPTRRPSSPALHGPPQSYPMPEPSPPQWRPGTLLFVLGVIGIVAMAVGIALFMARGW